MSTQFFTQDLEKKLCHAVEDGDVDEVRKLLNQGIDPDVKDAFNSTPLFYASKNGNPEVVKLLLEYGADPNARDASDLTSLHYAAREGHDRMVQLLLEYDADPTAGDYRGLTPFHFAMEGSNSLVVKLLHDSTANSQGLASASDLAALYVGKKLELTQLVQNVPRFTITINGNILKSTEPATDSIKTKYVLIQSMGRLSPWDRQVLESVGIKPLDYVSKNTYLCLYQGGDLENVRQLGIYVDFYRTEFKIPPSLKEAKPDQNYKVDIIFHENVATDSSTLQKDIEEKSRCSMNKIEFFFKKARLPIDGRYLNDVASIDDVRCIEEVGGVVAYNNIARQILRIDLQPPASPIQQQA